MRLMALIPAAVVLFGGAPAVAQEWTPFVSIEDGFSAVYPGPPKVETITYPTEYRMTLPGENRPVTLQGKVTKVELVNPHSWIWLDVKGPDGKVVNWGIEGGPPTNLFRNGITKATLPIGTDIKLFGYQAKSGESKGVGVFVEYLDGRKVFMGGSAPGADGHLPTTQGR